MKNIETIEDFLVNEILIHTDDDGISELAKQAKITKTKAEHIIYSWWKLTPKNRESIAISSVKFEKWIKSL